ncbi:UNVERIFIED_CONTAM: hypothetical protein PYX00_000489 [Menopon gallinae]|uniref:Chitin-binding type-4 domain-containing protein n=1 Tax=Menopon gallinae TaxID=328185 RepID=A0AAW2I984_9NEOP
MFLAASVFLFFVTQVSGHGMMLSPPSRSSMWRFGFDTPPNYNDNELFCGGFAVQWDKNGGKCGICGDAYHDKRPRENEHGGKYGTGKISMQYKEGSSMPVVVRLTAAHLGHFEYHICNMDKAKETEECFSTLLLDNGTDKYNVTTGPGDFRMNVKLPKGLRCKHCVLRWHYRGGNNWGQCPDGSWALGCGPQETFRNCADISVV